MLMYLYIGIAVVFVGLIGALRFQHYEVQSANTKAQTAQAQTQMAVAANVTLKGSIDGLRKDFQGSQDILTKLSKNDAGRIANANKIAEEQARIREAQAGIIKNLDAMRDADKGPKQTCDDETHKVLKDLADWRLTQ